MKMKPEHYAEIDAAIKALASGAAASTAAMWPGVMRRTLDAYVANPKISDPEKALRWQIFHAATVHTDIMQRLYTYLLDDHIDTALRALAKDNDFPTPVKG